MIPNFNITRDSIEGYAEMFDIPMDDIERAELPGQLAGGFSGISELWSVDVSGCEPATILPVDRSFER